MDILAAKLKNYFEIANNHIEMILKALKYVKPIYPLDSTFKEEIEDDLLLFALDSLIFRFAKLQDWLGQKIFKTFLEFQQYPTKGVGFLDILKELENEEILNIDLWAILREIRNELSHEYPNYSQIATNINFVIENCDNLIKISKKLEGRFLDEINKKRN